jgi:hypothetical protein
MMLGPGGAKGDAAMGLEHDFIRFVLHNHRTAFVFDQGRRNRLLVACRAQGRSVLHLHLHLLFFGQLISGDIHGLIGRVAVETEVGLLLF